MKVKIKKYVAKLVYVSLMTRVIVQEDATDEEIMELAAPRLIEKLQDESRGEHVEDIIDDEECPFDEDDAKKMGLSSDLIVGTPFGDFEIGEDVIYSVYPFGENLEGFICETGIQSSGKTASKFIEQGISTFARFEDDAIENIKKK